jgi:excisionase family DNA binding protein
MAKKKHAKTQPRWSTSLEPEGSEVLNADGAGRLLGVSPRLVLQLARKGKIPGRKIGREWRFRRAALLQWLGKVESPPDWLRPLIDSGRAEVIEKKKR